jgi:hypothetical protein
MWGRKASSSVGSYGEGVKEPPVAVARNVYRVIVVVLQKCTNLSKS